MAFETSSTYYSGQGVVMLGDRDLVTGKGYNFLPVGNCSDLKISVATSTIEHKESQSGARGIDLRLTTEIKANMSMTLDNFIPRNLGIALRGSYSAVTGATATSEANKLYMGSVAKLARIGVSAVTVKRGATSLVAYTNDSTAWDYKLNAAAGSIQFNDGQGGQLLASLTTLGTACASTFVTVSGSKLTYTFAATPAHAVVGGKAACVAATGTDAAFVNSKAFTITAVTGTTVEVELGATGKTITGTGTTLVVFDGDPTIAVDYTYASQSVVDALTSAASEKFVRFEGLNTANGNKSVVVEVFRFLTDPLKELALMSDNVQQYSIEGTVLMDALQTTGSKYFRQVIAA